LVTRKSIIDNLQTEEAKKWLNQERKIVRALLSR
jgi:hypothetical protein